MSRRVVDIRLDGDVFPDRYPPLPVAVVDGQGQISARATVSTAAPASIPFEADNTPLFVRLQLPNGQFKIEPLLEGESWRNSVSFLLGRESPNEWMAWSAMRVDLRNRLSPLRDQPGMQDAWMQMWQLESRYWRQVPLTAKVNETLHNQMAIQLELPASFTPRALVAHLGTGNPLVVSLPRNRNALVLVTTAHSVSTDPSVRMLVGGYGPEAEGILEFLRKGSIGAVDTVLDPGSEVANRLLMEKVEDPIAATAAAYYLLRKRDWDRLPQQWLRNLADWFGWIPDAHLIRDVSQIQRGMEPKHAPAVAAKCLKDALAMGLPFFAEARSLMEELIFYAERASASAGLDRRQRDLIRAMLVAVKPAGLTFGFFGDSPSKPLMRQQALEGVSVHGIERRIKTVSREMAELTGMSATTLAGKLDLVRGLKLAQQGISIALDAFGPAKRSRLPTDTKSTLFLRDFLTPVGVPVMGRRAVGRLGARQSS